MRAVESAGGFATVLARGEREAGTILILTIERGGNPRLYERMPRSDGTRKWHPVLAETAENSHKINDYLNRRRTQDPDLWVLELDIADGERFIGLPGTLD